LELFTASGTFQNVIDGQSRATLSGSFVVDLTTGFVVSTDLFHGATELNIIGNQGANDPTFPDVYLLQVTNSDGDLLALVLAATNNMDGVSQQVYWRESVQRIDLFERGPRSRMQKLIRSDRECVHISPD